MTKLNKSNQKAKGWKKQFFSSDCYSVQSFYEHCSYEKIRIENAICEKMKTMNCCNYRVINGNSFYFTCGYTSRDNKKLYVETFGNIFEIDL